MYTVFLTANSGNEQLKSYFAPSTEYEGIAVQTTISIPFVSLQLTH